MQTGNEIRAKQTCPVESFPILASEALGQSLLTEGAAAVPGQLWPGFRIKRQQHSQDIRLSYSDIFKALAQSGHVRRKLWAFSHVSGVAVRLVPLHPGSETPCPAQTAAAPLCQSILSTQNGAFACNKFVESLACCLGNQTPCTGQCFAGLTELAAPIAIGTNHVAVLLCGGFFQKQPNDFEHWLDRIRQFGIKVEETYARKVFLECPVFSRLWVTAIEEMLATLAGWLGEFAASCRLAQHSGDALCVRKARAFVAAHLSEMPTTRDVAREAHVSPQYFCRMFKRGAGMTFSEFGLRFRVEKARQLLKEPTLRITDVAFDAGFQSIPHFNRAFKRFTGTSPKDYRAALASHFETEAHPR